MATPRASKRFSPTYLTEKIIPVLLIMLVLTLLTVLIIVCFSLPV